MRGKPLGVRRSGSHAGLIPAHAGKTSRQSSLRRLTWAHPRACGENFKPRKGKGDAGGSSPRMRGKLPWRKITPGLDEAHPRACGENIHRTSVEAAGCGSSPRMRGKQSINSLVSVDLGLIPAHAGKTLISWIARSASWAHPRACGENIEL